MIADEVTDCANKEQLSVVLRYLNPDDSSIREDLVTFLECDSGITGQALANKILVFFQSHGVDSKKLRGQAYDEAGNMSGKTNGAAVLITSQFPLVLYLHCSSHCVNLSVVKSLEVASVRNMIGVVNRVSIFFSVHPNTKERLKMPSTPLRLSLQYAN